MSDKVNCVPYEIDYKRIVQEIQETLYKKKRELEEKLQDEKSPIRYIELNAVLTEVKQLTDYIYRMYEWYNKPVIHPNELQENK